MSELREFPRVPTHLDAKVTNGTGEVFEASISNLSPGGLMLRGDLDLKQHICLNDERDPMTQVIEIHVHSRLPDEPQPFLCRARMIYIRRLSQKEFELGFRFIDLSEIHAGMLHRFIFKKDPKVVPFSRRSVASG